MAKMGRIYHVVNKKPGRTAALKYHAVWVEAEDGGNERCLMLTDAELARAEARAKRNPEDVPKRGLLQNLID